MLVLVRLILIIVAIISCYYVFFLIKNAIQIIQWNRNRKYKYEEDKSTIDTEKILKNIAVKDIEKFLRKKKIEQLKKK